MSIANLAALLHGQRDLAGAQALYQRALAIRERVLGPEHPDTATTLNNLGGLLYLQGDRSGARSLLERALASRLKILGPDHPHTKATLDSLRILASEMS